LTRGAGLVVAGALGFVIACQSLMVSLSIPRRDELVDPALYERQAAAFAHGQIALLEQPVPALLARSDPYEPQWPWNRDILFDTILYRGRYYLYWGALPALLLVPFELLPASMHVPVKDSSVALAFSIFLVLTNVVLLKYLRQLLAPESPSWTLTSGWPPAASRFL